MKRTVPIPNREWNKPAETWPEIIDRYVAFIQVPKWRASVKSDGSEKPGCMSAEEARTLGDEMLKAVERLLPGHGPSREDLVRLAKRQGRNIPRDRRCSTKVGFHLQRSLLFNDAGYTCVYCGRTAWGVYAENTGKEPPRTLRFEIDHRVTRRRLSKPRKFDANNLVVACRSCNAIKAEMEEDRFRLELDSLASAVHRLRAQDPVTLA